MLYLNIVIPIICMCLNIVAQIVCYKYAFKKRLLRSEYAGFIFGLVSLVVCEFFVSRESPGEWVSLLCVNVIIYACLAYGYFSFINMGETARRIRLLREFFDAPQGLSKEQMRSRYNAAEVIGMRLNRLLNNNQVVVRDARYYVGNPIMLLISRAMIFMKMLILGKRSEHDIN